MSITFNNLTNTKVNFLNFLLSIGNRLLITNLTILVWGSEALGKLGILLAFVAGSTFIASIFELKLSKGHIVPKKFLVIGISCNVALIFLFQIISSNVELVWILLLFVIQVIVNLNLICSGFFFSIDKFVQYRKNCIKSEVIELLAFLCFVGVTRDPLLAMICSLLAKNLSLLLLSIREFFLHTWSGEAAVLPKKADKVTNKSHIMDVVGAQLMASVFPGLISGQFGSEVLGVFMFYRQFFMLGGVLQSAVFRGLWRDQLNGHINTTLLRSFALLIILIPAFVSIPILFFIEVADLYTFAACGLTFFILNWNRLNVLIDGHMLNKASFNAEIMFVAFFALYALFSDALGGFAISLIGAAVSSFLAKIAYESVLSNG